MTDDPQTEATEELASLEHVEERLEEVEAEIEKRNQRIRQLEENCVSFAAVEITLKKMGVEEDTREEFLTILENVAEQAGGEHDD